MLVWGKMEGENSAAAKFYILGKIANVTAEAVIATVEGTDFAERLRWDPSCLVLKTLSKEGADDVVQWRTDFPWPLSDREFVYRRRLERDGAGGAVAVSKAIRSSSDLVPVQSGVIRIRDFVQYCHVRALEDGSGVTIAMLYRNNMEASLPAWVVNWFASKGLPRYLGQLVGAVNSWADSSTPSSSSASPDSSDSSSNTKNEM